MPAADGGTAPLRAGLSPHEVFRRATLSPAAARRTGPGTVICYREPAEV